MTRLVLRRQLRPNKEERDREEARLEAARMQEARRLADMENARIEAEKQRMRDLEDQEPPMVAEDSDYVYVTTFGALFVNDTFTMFGDRILHRKRTAVDATYEGRQYPRLMMNDLRVCVDALHSARRPASIVGMVERVGSMVRSTTGPAALYFRDLEIGDVFTCVSARVEVQELTKVSEQEASSVSLNGMVRRFEVRSGLQVTRLSTPRNTARSHLTTRNWIGD